MIILNYLKWKETIKCVKSVLASDYPNFECIVVDNHSENDSVENISIWLSQNEGISDVRTYKGEGITNSENRILYECSLNSDGCNVRVILLATEWNLGYSGGNNVGIIEAVSRDCDYVLILNNDLVIENGFIREMVHVARDSVSSIVGALIKDSSGEKRLFSGASLFSAWWGIAVRRSRPLRTWWRSDIVQGCGMMLEKKVLDQRKRVLGYYLDPSLFLYHEEIELGMWCRSNNVKSVIAGKAVAFHEVGKSSGGSENPLTFYYQTRNRLLIARRYFSLTGLAGYVCAYVPFRLVRAMTYLLGGCPEIAIAITSGLLDGLRNVSGPKS